METAVTQPGGGRPGASPPPSAKGKSALKTAASKWRFARTAVVAMNKFAHAGEELAEAKATMGAKDLLGKSCTVDTAKPAILRSKAALDSEKVGELAPGSVVKVLEFIDMDDGSRRVRCEKGWLTAVTKDQKLLCGRRTRQLAAAAAAPPRQRPPRQPRPRRSPPPLPPPPPRRRPRRRPSPPPLRLAPPPPTQRRARSGGAPDAHTQGGGTSNTHSQANRPGRQVEDTRLRQQGQPGVVAP